MQRLRLALLAASSAAVFWSNIVLFLGAFSLYMLYAGDSTEFRFGISFALGYNEALPALTLWKKFASVTLFLVLWVFVTVFFQKENIKKIEERAYFLVRQHPGRVYFIYPYRLLRYLAILLAPRASTPR